MRALFFVDTPHRLAGAQRSLLAAVTAARVQGLDPIIAVPAGGALPDACREAGLEVRLLEGSAAFGSFGKALLRLGAVGQAGVVVRELVPYATRFARLIDSERAEVVHFNTGRGAIMAGMGAHLSGRDVVLHVRGTPGVSRRYWTAAQAMCGWFILVARALEPCLSPAARPRSRVVYNGVVVRPPLPRGEARARLVETGAPDHWVRSDIPVFASLSSLVPFKGLHHLVRAVRILKDRGIEARFVLAGTGVGDAYEAWLKTLPRELGVEDRIAFVGFTADAHALLSGVDGLVLPSVEREALELPGGAIDVRGNEGLPRSILEAMSLGLPVVATDIAGVSEQIEPEHTGLLVPPGDVEALANALGRLAVDRDLRVAARVGTEIIRTRFSVESAAEGLLSVLREASTSRRAGARVWDATRVLAEGLRPS